MDLEIYSPAKINLFLKVAGRREDGYHNILSLMQPISLFDSIRLKVEDGEGVTVTVDIPGIPTDSGNLAFAAAERFMEEAGLKKRIHIDIEKNIPVGAGLGGGSSNAGSVLFALNTLYGEPLLTPEALSKLALELGSDVPFFLLKGPAFASGRGEKLERTMIPPYSYVLINPGFEVSASWAYSNLDLTKINEDNILIYSNYTSGPPVTLKDIISNDLEAAVAKSHGEIDEIKKLLMDSGAHGALMSGSGPTVFGVFNSPQDAGEALAKIRKVLPDRWLACAASGL